MSTSNRTFTSVYSNANNADGQEARTSSGDGRKAGKFESRGRTAARAIIPSTRAPVKGHESLTPALWAGPVRRVGADYGLLRQIAPPCYPEAPLDV